MAAKWILVKAFIREASEDEDFEPIDDIADAVKKLRQIQRGHFTTSTEAGDGLTQIRSKIGETEFQFAVPGDLNAAGIIEVAETALELIDGKTVAQARKLLKRRKRTSPDFRGLCH